MKKEVILLVLISLTLFLPLPVLHEPTRTTTDQQHLPAVFQQQGIPQNSLVAHWTFDEGSGTSVGDSSGNANTGTISGATWQLADDCISGNCIALDGTDDYIDVPTNSFSLGGDFSISYWENPTSINAADQNQIITRFFPFNQRQFNFGHQPNGNLQFGLGTATCASNNPSNTDMGVSIPNDQWSHVVWNVLTTQGQVDLYIDGSFAASASFTANDFCSSSNANVNIGRRGDGNEYFNGQLDEIAVWDRSLTTTEITQLAVTPVCGDGMIEGTEACDDSNTNPGDGCSATCQVESGWQCSGQPSSCVMVDECTDGIDNDGDGATDSADYACGQGGPFENSHQSQCQDGIDNDGDGWTDLTDLGCDDNQDNDESLVGTTQCSDQTDNDGDTLVDGNDPDCADPNDNDESTMMGGDGTTYYLDAVNGNDANPGTSAQPWQTLTQAQSVLQSGDTVLLRNGTYGTYTETISADRTDWITYRADTGHTPVFDRVTMTCSSNDAYSRFDGIEVNYPDPGTCTSIHVAHYTGCNHIEFLNGTIRAEAIYSTHRAMMFSGGHTLRVENSEVTNTAVGLRFYGNNVYIINNTVHHVQASLVGTLGDNVVIKDNHLYDQHHYTNESCYNSNGWPTAHSSGIAIRGDDNWTVVGNHMHDVTQPGIQLYASEGAQLYHHQNYLFENNTIYDIPNAGAQFLVLPNGEIHGPIIFRQNTLIGGGAAFFNFGRYAGYNGAGSIFENNLVVNALLGIYVQTYQNIDGSVINNMLTQQQGNFPNGQWSPLNYFIAEEISAGNIPSNYADTEIFVNPLYTAQHGLTCGPGGPCDFTPKPGSLACNMSTAGSHVGAIPCTTSGPGVTCGNGIQEGGEQCDEGASNSACGPVCTDTCTLYVPTCGNGCMDTGETCGEPGHAACGGSQTCSMCQCQQPPQSPPVMSNGAPTGAQPIAFSSIISLTTDIAATCKYSTTNENYASMPNTFTSTGNLTHTQTVSVEPGQSYTYYTHCQEGSGETTTTPLTITFSIDPIVLSTTTFLGSLTHLPSNPWVPFPFALERLNEGALILQENISITRNISIDDHASMSHLTNEQIIDVDTGGSGISEIGGRAAQLFFYNVGYVQPHLYHNGQVCGSDCTTLTEVTSGTYETTVSQGFSNYTLQEACIDSDSDGEYVNNGVCVVTPFDCDDTNNAINSQATEICDGVDNNCDGTIDEGCSCSNGQTQVCGLTQGVCSGTTQETCTGGQWPGCSYGANYEAAETLCDGLDNDCNGQTDDIANATLCANQIGVCAGSTQTCGGASGWQSCTVANYAAHSTFYEQIETLCDGLDNDCDGNVDEGCTLPINNLLGGNGSSVTTNFANTEVYINHSTTTPTITNNSGVIAINITNNGTTVAHWNYNTFFNQSCNLANVTLLVQNSNATTGTTVASGICLPPNTTKTLSVQKVTSSSNAVCVLDQAVTTLTTTSSDCTGANETIVTCDGTTQSTYTCTDTGTHLVVSGLAHTAVSEHTVSSGSTSTSSSGGGGGGGGGGGSSSSGGGGGGGGSSVSNVPPTTSETALTGYATNPECQQGQTRQCGTSAGECTIGTQACSNGQWTPCLNSQGPQKEKRDGLDNDCDGQIDEDTEGVALILYIIYAVLLIGIVAVGIVIYRRLRTTSEVAKVKQQLQTA